MYSEIQESSEYAPLLKKFLRFETMRKTIQTNFQTFNLQEIHIF